MGKQRCLHALLRSCSRLFPSWPVHDLHHCYDENPYVSLIRHSTDVYCYEVFDTVPMLSLDVLCCFKEHSVNHAMMWSNHDVPYVISTPCIPISRQTNWPMWLTRPASFAEKICKRNRVSNAWLVNIYSIRIACVHGFNDSRHVGWTSELDAVIHVHVAGPICRTTVLRPAAHRPAANQAQPGAPPPAQAPAAPPAPPAAGGGSSASSSAAAPPPPPSQSSSSSMPSSTLPPVFNFAPFNTAANATTVGGGAAFQQFPFGSPPMVLPPFGRQQLLVPHLLQRTFISFQLFHHRLCPQWQWLACPKKPSELWKVPN